MKKNTMRMLALFGIMAMLLCGCQKNEEDAIDPNMEQPVLGVDETGYGGFTYLKAYSFGEEGGNSVLYLPKDENAYVGATTIISKTEGVEVTLNYNPMLSDDIVNKKADDKLQYILDSEYADVYTESFVNLDRAPVEEIGDNAASSNLSYLVYNEEQKSYVANWLGHYYVELEDEREFRVTVKVDSTVETAQSEVVVEELEKYFGVDFSYESGTLQAKIDDYEPNASDQAKMDGVQHTFSLYKFYLPEEWVENEIANVFFEKDQMKALDEVEGAATLFTEHAYDTDPSMAILFINLNMKGVDLGGLNMSSGQFGVFSDGEMQVITQKMVGDQTVYEGTATSVDAIGYTDLGYVFKSDLEGFHGYDCRLYEIYYAENAVAMYVLIDQDAENKEEFLQLADQIYENMELK